MIRIPENELEIKFVRSSGPGGQNVNRRATKVQLRWNIEKSKILTQEQKEQLQQSPFIQLTINDEIIVESQEERFQERNKEIAIQKLNQLVNKALKKKKKRIPTKPSRAAKEKRLKEKKRKSEIKKSRQKIKHY